MALLLIMGCICEGTCQWSSSSKQLHELLYLMIALLLFGFGSCTRSYSGL